MKKMILTLIVFCCTASLCNAQKPAMSVYGELGGPGLASINFDTRFSKSENGIGGRVGFGGFSVDGDGALFIPIGLNYLIGENTKNYFEVGGGISVVSISSKSNNGNGVSTSDNFRNTFGYLSLGYRYQPQTSGFTFRAAITPVFGSGFFIPYYAGISFGYKF